MWLSEAAEGSTAVSREQEVLSLFQDVLTPAADGPAAVAAGLPHLHVRVKGCYRFKILKYA